MRAGAGSWVLGGEGRFVPEVPESVGFRRAGALESKIPSQQPGTRKSGKQSHFSYADPVGPESLLFTELGLESLDAVVLATAIQEHYQTQMRFVELLAEIVQQQRDGRFTSWRRLRTGM